MPKKYVVGIGDKILNERTKAITNNQLAISQAANKLAEMNRDRFIANSSEAIDAIKGSAGNIEFLCGIRNGKYKYCLDQSDRFAASNLVWYVNFGSRYAKRADFLLQSENNHRDYSLYDNRLYEAIKAVIAEYQKQWMRTVDEKGQRTIGNEIEKFDFASFVSDKIRYDVANIHAMDHLQIRLGEIEKSIKISFMKAMNEIEIPEASRDAFNSANYKYFAQLIKVLTKHRKAISQSDDEDAKNTYDFAVVKTLTRMQEIIKSDHGVFTAWLQEPNGTTELLPERITKLKALKTFSGQWYSWDKSFCISKADNGKDHIDAINNMVKSLTNGHKDFSRKSDELQKQAQAQEELDTSSSSVDSEKENKENALAIKDGGVSQYIAESYSKLQSIMKGSGNPMELINSMVKYANDLLDKGSDEHTIEAVVVILKVAEFYGFVADKIDGERTGDRSVRASRLQESYIFREAQIIMLGEVTEIFKSKEFEDIKQNKNSANNFNLLYIEQSMMDAGDSLKAQAQTRFALTAQQIIELNQCNEKQIAERRARNLAKRQAEAQMGMPRVSLPMSEKAKKQMIISNALQLILDNKISFDPQTNTYTIEVSEFAAAVEPSGVLIDVSGSDRSASASKI